MKKAIVICSILLHTFSVNAQMSREDSVMMRRSAEVDFVVDQIENSYIFGRRGISDDEWNRRVAIVRDKILSVKLDSISRQTHPYANAYSKRYFGMLIEDSHFSFPNSGQFSRVRAFNGDDLIFPVWVRTWTDGTVYCERDYSGAIPHNAQIISVNGRSAQQMALHSRELYPGEPRAAMASMRGNRAFDPYTSTNFSNYLHLEFIRPPYYVQYKDDQGVIKTVQVQSMTRKDVKTAFKKTVGSKRDRKAKYGESYGEFMHYKKVDDSIGVLTINMFWGRSILEILIFGTDAVYENTLKATMARIARDKISHLIIDISSNSGGMGDNIYKTLNYFADSPVERNETYLLTKDNRQILRTVIASGDHRYMGLSKKQLKEFQTLVDSLPDGTMFSTDTLHNLVFTPTPVKHKFKGKCYLITGRATYSAGQQFAQYFRQLRLGPIAGEPCGGYEAISGGNAAYVRLPYSSWLTFMVPYSRAGKKSDTPRFEYDEVDIPLEMRAEDWLNSCELQSTPARLIEMIKSKKIEATK